LALPPPLMVTGTSDVFCKINALLSFSVSVWLRTIVDAPVDKSKEIVSVSVPVALASAWAMQ
jgi:hypothetical protein